MSTNKRQRSNLTIARGTALSLVLTTLLLLGCGRDTSTPANSEVSSNSSANAEKKEFGVVLRADPNPVPAGSDPGKTTIFWQTGSEAEADIYQVEGTNENLIATGTTGSKEAVVHPGSNEFRLYNKGEHKLVTHLVVTMAPAK